MDNRKELKDREKIVKQIAKTSNSIRKNYRVLKNGKMEEDIAQKDTLSLSLPLNF